MTGGTTVVAGRATTFDVSFGRCGGGGHGSGGMGGRSLPREANSARYSSLTEGIVDDIIDSIVHWI